MRLISLAKYSPQQWSQLVQRPAVDYRRLFHKVRPILEDVRRRGDTALCDYTRRYDKVSLPKKRLKISDKEIETSLKAIPPSFKEAVAQAYQNILAVHRPQLPPRFIAGGKGKWKKISPAPGITCWQEMRPLDRVGLYIPGGRASYPSTILMLGVPAQLAGCKEIVLCTPPQLHLEMADILPSINTSILNSRTSNIQYPMLPLSPYLLYTAHLLGIRQIYPVGGAQAIAAMAYGTQTVPKVDKIFGPGNAYVSTAKILVSQDPEGAAIDAVAGPSELLVLADDSAPAGFIAADLLSQAEHGPDSQVLLVTPSRQLLRKVQEEMTTQLATLPRQDLLRASLKHSRGVLAQNIEQAISFTNAYAPEHLEIVTRHPENVLARIHHAGSIFLGPYSPVPVGDYVSGTNHVLPTSGWAKTCSGVSVRDFLKTLYVQKLTPQGLKQIRKTVTTLATTEGLIAHARALAQRFP